MNDRVRVYWEQEPCGASSADVGDRSSNTRDWYEQIERRRYDLEPFVHSVAQFTRHHGRRVLEVGVGAGTDHLQWARAGAICFGVDLTDAAVELTRDRLEAYGFGSVLARLDAEKLPFADGFFDVVYSWGVIHHAEHPERIVAEIHRVLRPGGLFVGMMYGRHSAVAVKLWVKHGLLRLRPWRSLRSVVWHHMESVGTKSYTRQELRGLFGAFAAVTLEPIVTPYDRAHLPAWLGGSLPRRFGWFIAIHAIKANEESRG